jgi:flagellar biosynthetic protein FliO
MWRKLIKNHKAQRALVALLLAASLAHGALVVAVAAEGETAQPAPAAQPVSTQPVSASPASQPDTSAQPDDRLPFMLKDEGGTTDQPGGFGMLARTVGALLLIIGLLVASMWCLRRIKGSRFGAATEDARLAVLSTVSIGDRRSLTVVRFGDRLLLLGSTQQSVTLLASDDSEALSDGSEYMPPRSVAEVLGESEEANQAQTKQGQTKQGQTPSFADELEQLEKWC